MCSQWRSEAETKDKCAVIMQQLHAKLCVWKLDREKLDELLPKLQEKESLLGLYHLLAKGGEQIHEEIVKYVESVGLDYDVLILGGLTLWKIEKFTEAVTVFQKVTKFDIPQFAKVKIVSN